MQDVRNILGIRSFRIKIKKEMPANNRPFAAHGIYQANQSSHFRVDEKNWSHTGKHQEGKGRQYYT